VLAGLFGWSLTSAGHAPSLHGVKVAVVGPAPLSAALAANLDAHHHGAIALRTSPTVAAAVGAVRDRSVYAALVLSPPHLYVASAAGPAVSAALETVFTQAFQARHATLAVSDVRPLDPGDPRGLAVLYVIISTVIGSVAYSVVRSILFPRAGAVALAGSTAAFAVLAGLAEAVAVDPAVGALGGAFGPVVLGAAVVAAAVTAITGGLLAVLGLPGAGVAALVVVIAGNASSGGASAPELVDGFWRHLGPYLPPGAGATLLRNLVYFDGQAIATALAVLLAYLVAGAALTAVAAWRPAGGD